MPKILTIIVACSLLLHGLHLHSDPFIISLRICSNLGVLIENAIWVWPPVQGCCFPRLSGTIGYKKSIACLISRISSFNWLIQYFSPTKETVAFVQLPLDQKSGAPFQSEVILNGLHFRKKTFFWLLFQIPLLVCGPLNASPDLKVISYPDCIFVGMGEKEDFS